MKIEYVTSNRAKFEEAQLVLKDWELEQVNLDLTEIQGERYKILATKAREAVSILQRPLIVEDISLNCAAINGLPGPYIKDVLLKLGHQGFCELIHKYKDHSSQAICLVAYAMPGLEPVIFEGIVDGQIVKPKGDLHHGKVSFNPIFLPKGSSKTFGEMTMEEHSKCSMRQIALLNLKSYLEINNHEI